MTYELFPDSPAPSEHPSTDTQGYDIHGIMQQLMAQTGCSAEEAGAAVMRQLAAKKAAKALPDVPYSKLQTEAERTEYMRRIRESTQSSVMDKRTREMHESEQTVADAQKAFAERMRQRSVDQGPMRSNAAAVDFFRNGRK
ncbi:hypothetical protein [Pantoea agglomerans]|uniref:hypothetical protein n=1 Tax=Enterobacter agglomerans TaxID=549 RepID=UPI00301BA803